MRTRAPSVEDRVTELLTRLGTTEEQVAFALRAAGITGWIGRGYRCPIANYLTANGVTIGYVTCERIKLGDAEAVMPGPIGDFVAAFDEGRYPQLVTR